MPSGAQPVNCHVLLPACSARLSAEALADAALLPPPAERRSRRAVLVSRWTLRPPPAVPGHNLESSPASQNGLQMERVRPSFPGEILRASGDSCPPATPGRQRSLSQGLLLRCIRPPPLLPCDHPGIPTTSWIASAPPRPADRNSIR